MEWLRVERGAAPVVLTVPHSGVTIPEEIEARLASAWLARKDTDWWVDSLYGFARELDVTVVRTAISRTVIDVNRDPSGRSLYPGQATTGLCPDATFDGEPLYREAAPDATEVAARRARWFDPFHAAIREELARLTKQHRAVVLYDAHSIRSIVPRLFEGRLPHFNIGTNGGASCAPALTAAVEAACASTDFSRVTNGRFKGGYITRHYGRPDQGVHALQMELACRGYVREPIGEYTEATWPVPYDAAHAAPLRAALEQALRACIAFARDAAAQ